MRVSRAEAEQILAQRRPADAPYVAAQNAIASRFLEQAKVATHHLTGSHEWNVFLQRVQAWIDQERATLAAMSDSTLLPNLTSEQILQAHRHMLAAKTRIDAWEQVLQLPKQILETGDKADDKKVA